MIVDDCINDRMWKIVFPRTFRERVSAAWRRAHRFNFSPEASRLAGTLAIDAGELVINHRQFALPPFPCTYVEFDSREFFRDADALPSAITDVYGFAEHNTDKRFGYLIDGHDVYSFGFGDSSRGVEEVAGMVCWYYDLRRPGEDAGGDTFWLQETDAKLAWPRGPMVDKVTHDWRWWKASLMLGRTFATFAAQRALDDMLRSCSVKAILHTKDLPHAAVAKMIQGSMGDIRNLWAALLWLNQPGRVVYENVPGERRIRRGKLTTYHPYRTVEITLGRKYRSIRRAYLAGAPRIQPGEHSVRGEFHHHGGLKVGCSHEWPLIPEPSPSGKSHGIYGIWTCQRCGRRRWFVESHKRGDPSRPIVHDYVINTEKESV